MSDKNLLSFVTASPAERERPSMGPSTSAIDLPQLFESDEVAWLDEMTRLIGQKELHKLDFDHLKECLEDMAIGQRREAKNRCVQLIFHLLKWEFQPRKRSRSWETTIAQQRFELEDMLESKVLRNYVNEKLGETYRRAVTLAVKETGLDRGDFPLVCPYPLDFILGDALPSKGKS